VAFSTESSSLSRVDEWVKDLEIQQPPPDNDFGDDSIGSMPSHLLLMMVD